MKWRSIIKWVALGTAVLVIGLAFARPWLIRWGVERALENALGGEIELGRIESSLRQSRLSLQDLRIINPTVWPADAEWIIREITVIYAWQTLFSQTIRLQEATLDIQQIRLTMDMDSLMNLQNTATGRPASSRPNRTSSSDPPPAAAPETQQQQPPSHRQPAPVIERQLHIGQLNFRLGRIDMQNALFGEIEDEPVTIILNLEQTFYDVEDMDRVVQALTRSLLFAVPSRR